MVLYIIIVVVVVVVGAVLFLTMRNRLKVESVNFDNEINDIASAFEKDFEKCYVSGSDERLFIDRFTPVFNDACSLKHRGYYNSSS